MKTVEENPGKMEAQLRQWGSKLDELLAKAAAARTGVKVDYRRRLDDLKAKYDGARRKLDESKAAGTKKWGVVKTGLGAACHDLETAFQKLGESSGEATHEQPRKTEPPVGTA